MAKIGLRIESNYSHHLRKRHYVEDVFLDFAQMRGAASANHLRRLFPRDAGISLEFEGQRVVIKILGMQQCKLNGEEMRQDVNYILFPCQKKILNVDNLSFTIESFIHGKDMHIAKRKVIFIRP